MKAIMKKLFSFSITDTKIFNDDHDKIELVSCPIKEMMCNVHLSSVNKSYLESEQYHKSKNYHKSIDSLKNAFYKANELMDLPCTKCAQQYRINIVKALANIHSELEEMSKGIFGNKDYQSSYLMAKNALKEFENTRICNSVQLNESKMEFLGNYLN
jgi:hypothetical protein